MHNVEPKVTLIARSAPEGNGILRWLKDHGVSDARALELSGDRCDDGTVKSPGDQIIEAGGRRCYMSFEPRLNPNVTRIREDIGEYIDNILHSMHGSVIEHVSYSFAIENVSRVFTAEMNRHRAGMAISEGSMRYIRLEDIPYWIPTSIQSNHTDSVELCDKKKMSRDRFKLAFQQAEINYKAMLDIWKEELDEKSKFSMKKEITSMMRRIIPIGVASGGIWTGNLRAWRHILTMRCAASAEEEIRLVAEMIFVKLREAEPHVFADFERNEKGFVEPKHRKV